VRFLLITLFLTVVVSAKYLSNESCKECHEDIYHEYQSSMHSKSYFNDELHRKIANKVSDKRYECASCHMPMADNLKDLIDGKAKPDKNNITHTDAISCYFCHTIAYVKKAHKHFVNIKAKQIEGFKPSFYGTLKDVDHNDKHESLKNPIYTKNVCKGCHAYKKNDYNTTIFRAMKDDDSSESCIKCHMPKVKGGVENFDKKSRFFHKSHRFLGIHDAKFRQSGVDINISVKDHDIKVRLHNKMAHPLIVQPARVKYLELILIRDKKVIWRNFKIDPKEDQKIFFEYKFYDKNHNSIIIPSQAYGIKRANNLNAHESKDFIYHGIDLKKGDTVIATLYVRFAKRDCQKVVKLKDDIFKRSYIIKSVKKVIKR